LSKEADTSLGMVIKLTTTGMMTS